MRACAAECKVASSWLPVSFGWMDGWMVGLGFVSKGCYCCCWAPWDGLFWLVALRMAVKQMGVQRAGFQSGLGFLHAGKMAPLLAAAAEKERDGGAEGF